MTAQNLIERAFKLISIHSPGTQDLSDGLELLNEMVSLWGTNRLLVYAIISENFTLSVGTATYTIGSGGDFDTVRPNRIVDAYIKDSSSNDYPVDTHMTKDDYNEITAKGQDGRPGNLLYVPSYPLGKIYLDYEPSAAEDLYIDSWKSFTEFAALATSVSLPLEYIKAIRFNLALDLAPLKNTEPKKWVINQAKDSKKAIMSLNVHPVEEMEFDDSITNNTVSSIYTL